MASSTKTILAYSAGQRDSETTDAHYSLCRVHETLGSTPAVAHGISDRVWSLGNLLDAALAVASPDPTKTAPERRRRFRIIQGR